MVVRLSEDETPWDVRIQAGEGLNLRAHVLAARLLEDDDDLSFYNVLRNRPELDLYGGGNEEWFEPHGQLEIWWGIEIEARSWGIKDISVYIRKFVLDGWYEDESGNTVNQTFHYEYPNRTSTPEAGEPIGPDADAPTLGNVYRLSKPEWKVDWKKNPDRSSYMPTAEVDLNRHTIKFEF